MSAMPPIILADESTDVHDKVFNQTAVILLMALGKRQTIATTIVRHALPIKFEISDIIFRLEDVLIKIDKKQG